MITALDGGLRVAGSLLPREATTQTATRLADAGLAVSLTEFAWLEQLVETATGPAGLVIIFVYSFLIAFALPGVSEVVLLAPLELGLSDWARLTLIILVSGAVKAVGSVLAFHLGQ